MCATVMTFYNSGEMLCQLDYSTVNLPTERNNDGNGPIGGTCMQDTAYICTPEQEYIYRHVSEYTLFMETSCNYLFAIYLLEIFRCHFQCSYMHNANEAMLPKDNLPNGI